MQNVLSPSHLKGKGLNVTTSLLVRPSKISADSDSSGISDDDSDAWYLEESCGLSGFFALFSDTAENAAMV